MCVCVCVCERERERERKIYRNKAINAQKKKEESLHVKFENKFNYIKERKESKFRKIQRRRMIIKKDK